LYNNTKSLTHSKTPANRWTLSNKLNKFLVNTERKESQRERERTNLVL
jgi:hypothetical protein